LYGRGVDRLAVRTFPRFLVAREAMNTGGVARMEADEAGVDQVTVLLNVEAGDEVVVANVAFGW